MKNIFAEFKKFEDTNKDKLALPYNKELIEAYRAKFSDIENLPIVLQFAENYLKSDLFTQNVFVELKPFWQSDPEVRIYAVMG